MTNDHQATGDASAADPYPNPHSPAARRRLSNIGHWVEGAVLGVASTLSLADAARPDLGWPGRWSSRAAAGAGTVLGGGILVGTLHHGGPRRYLRHESQDREHMEMAALISTGGLIVAAAESRISGLAGAYE